MVEQAAQQDRERHADRRLRDRREPGAGEDSRQQNSEQCETGDPECRRGEADHDRQQDAAAQPARQLP
jgi:hypothetical protein